VILTDPTSEEEISFYNIKNVNLNILFYINNIKDGTENSSRMHVWSIYTTHISIDIISCNLNIR